MGGIKEKKRKGRSIGSDRREEEDNYFKLFFETLRV